MKYVLTEAAIEDVREIVNYIKADSPRNARKVALKLREQFRRIARTPGIGHVREELHDDRLRVSSVYRYLIIYDVTQRPLPILRVIHGARNLNWVRPH
ncbi:MAG: type II toxin-antitoxin system RelE/ParE family toxin [Tepidisphaerales bacterium]